MIKKIKSTDFERILRVALYLRLSKEDLDKLTPEERSESIKNQEIMLRAYAEDNGWKIIGVYDDEDYSGSDRDRPNFNKMIKECENGNVDVVLVKTQARFARDIELVDKYVHNKFKEWNVRFVTYIERIDNTKYETKKTSQITAMKDEWMLEDTSINIRETFKSKRAKGQFTGSFASYGYMKDKENKNHLVIDSVVSNNIVRIFEEYDKGYGMNKIAEGLTNDNILSPLEYKLFNGINLKLPIIKDYVDYDSIDKAGTFIARATYLNDERQILKNLTTIEIFSDDILFNNKLDISLVKVKTEKINIYYSTKKLDELNIKIENNKYIYENNFNFDDNTTWIKLNENDCLPKNTTCIATNIKELDRTHEVYYDFEIKLKENRRHLNYYYNIYPSSDNKNVNLKYKICIRNKHKWSTSTIRKILTDEIYIGNLVQFKTTTVSYKNHTIIYNDSDTQIRVENTHEPIVSLELWNSVQEKLSKSKKSCKNGKVHILVNKIYCESCHGVFYKCGKNNSTGYGYLCCRDKKTGWSNCSNKKWISEEFLHNYIMDKINALLKDFYSTEKQIEIDNNVVENDLFKEQINNLIKEKNNICKELKNKNSYFQGLYEDLKRGLLDENQYMSLRTKYKEDNNKLEERLNTIDGNLLSIETQQNKLKNKKVLFNKYKQIDELNIEIIDDFIDKIEIGEYNENQNNRNIHIIWNFEE